MASLSPLSPLDSTQPPDTQSIALGAAAIRNLTANLDEMLSQLFDSNFNFLTGCISAPLLGVGAVTAPALSPGAVTAPALSPGAVTTPTIAAGAVTPVQLSFLVPKVNYGTYDGSNSASVTVAGLPFAPQLVLVTGGSAQHACGMAFLTEASGGAAPVHALFLSAAILAPYYNAVNFNADGFTINSSNFVFSQAGVVHSYVALG